MSVKRWQDVYLSKDADDIEYETMSEMLSPCPDCRQWDNEGWIVIPVQSEYDEDECEPMQVLCETCKGTGKVLS